MIYSARRNLHGTLTPAVSAVCAYSCSYAFLNCNRLDTLEWPGRVYGFPVTWTCGQRVTSLADDVHYQSERTNC